MQISPLVILGALAASVIAAPTAPANKWTIENFKRTCDKKTATCHYSYGIETHNGKATECSYAIKGGSPDKEAYGNIRCGAFTVSSSWSGQFGAANGFQTLSIVNHASKEMVYVAYADKELANDKVVKPDKSADVKHI